MLGALSVLLVFVSKFVLSSLNILWWYNFAQRFHKKYIAHGKVLVNLMSNCHSPLHAYQFTLIELIGSVGARAKLLSEINKGKGWGNQFFSCNKNKNNNNKDLAWKLVTSNSHLRIECVYTNWNEKIGI